MGEGPACFKEKYWSLWVQGGCWNGGPQRLWHLSHLQDAAGQSPQHPVLASVLTLL